MTGRSDARGIAVVTGGAGAGIGHGISTAMAADGWHVVIADCDDFAAGKLSAKLVDAGASAESVALNVAEESAVDMVMDEIATRLGSIDALVNSAGVGLISPLGSISTPEWDRLFAVDLRGAWLTSRACLRHMVPRRKGVLIHVGSIQALGAAEGYGGYAAAKAGLVAMSRGLAADYGHLGIRSVVIHPGLVDSPQNREIFANFGEPERFISDYISLRQMLPQLITPGDIGNAVTFLASPGASAVTGTELVVDGGSSAMSFDRRSGA